MIMEPKSLGILGLGNLSTLFYIKELNNLYNKQFKGYSTCPFKLLNTNFDAINSLLPNTSKSLDTIVKQYIDDLISLKVNVILVPNITLHQTLDRLNISIPIVHPLESTITKIQKNKCKKVLLLASIYTMHSSYIKSYFANNDIDVFLPSKEDMQYVDDVRKQIYEGTETKKMLKDYNYIVEKYARNNAVVIACTELSLRLVNKEGLEIFDMSRIQINQSIKAITEK